MATHGSATAVFAADVTRNRRGHRTPPIDTPYVDAANKVQRW